MKAFLYLMRRELWEHRALWIVPACVGAMMVVTAIAAVTVTGYVSGKGATVRIVRVSQHEEAIAEARRQLDKAVQQLHAELQSAGGQPGATRLEQEIARLQERLDAARAKADTDQAKVQASIDEAIASIDKAAAELAAKDGDAHSAVSELAGRIAGDAARIARENLLVARIQIGADMARHRDKDTVAIDIQPGGAMVVDGKTMTLEELLQRYAALPEQRRAAEARRVVYGTAAVFYLFVFVVVFFYALDSLYGERKDRSALFWKSLPVSDLKTVLSKVATAIVTAALIALVCVVVTQALIMTILSAAVSWYGLSAWQLVWQPAGVAIAWPSLLLVFAVLGLWMLPVYAWAFLVSSWVRRSPFVVAIVVPLAAVLLEGWIAGTSHLADAVSARFGQFVSVSQVDVEMAASVDGKTIALRPELDQFRVAAATDLLARPEMWIGLVLSVALIAGAVWFRRYRDEG